MKKTLMLVATLALPGLAFANVEEMPLLRRSLENARSGEKYECSMDKSTGKFTIRHEGAVVGRKDLDVVMNAKNVPGKLMINKATGAQKGTGLMDDFMTLVRTKLADTVGEGQARLNVNNVKTLIGLAAKIDLDAKDLDPKVVQYRGLRRYESYTEDGKMLPLKIEGSGVSTVQGQKKFVTKQFRKSGREVALLIKALDVACHVAMSEATAIELGSKP